MRVCEIVQLLPRIWSCSPHQGEVRLWGQVRLPPAINPAVHRSIDSRIWECVSAMSEGMHLRQRSLAHSEAREDVVISLNDTSLKTTRV